MKGCTPRLVLKQREKTTRKLPIEVLTSYLAAQDWQPAARDLRLPVERPGADLVANAFAAGAPVAAAVVAVGIGVEAVIPVVAVETVQARVLRGTNDRPRRVPAARLLSAVLDETAVVQQEAADVGTPTDKKESEIEIMEGS